MTAAQLALEHGLACSTAGGTHHAFPSAGAGFCIVNDLAITAEALLRTHARVNRVLILDLDVHQGDGTAACFSGRQDVFTCSFHAEKNFPTRKEKSTLDVGLPDGMADDAYCRCDPCKSTRLLANTHEACQDASGGTDCLELRFECLMLLQATQRGAAWHPIRFPARLVPLRCRRGPTQERRTRASRAVHQRTATAGHAGALERVALMCPRPNVPARTATPFYGLEQQAVRNRLS